MTKDLSFNYLLNQMERRKGKKKKTEIGIGDLVEGGGGGEGGGKGIFKIVIKRMKNFLL